MTFPTAPQRDHDGDHVLPPAEDYQRFVTEVQYVLDGVDSALNRLRDGNYGRCEVCSSPIGDDALAETPLVRWCEQHLALAESA